MPAQSYYEYDNIINYIHKYYSIDGGNMPNLFITEFVHIISAYVRNNTMQMLAPPPRGGVAEVSIVDS